MSILSEQLVISDKVISNVITTDPEAESVTMRNGYYVDHKYPDNRPEMTGESYFVGVNNGIEDISESKTAGQIG